MTLTNYELGLFRLKATLDKLKNLDESNFHYADYISDFDQEKYCPTIGCVAGYLPFWFTDTPFRYVVLIQQSGERITALSYLGVVHCSSITTGLCNYFECKKDIIEALFYGEKLYEIQSIDTNNATLKDVITRFEEVISGIENGQLSWN